MKRRTFFGQIGIAAFARGAGPAEPRGEAPDVIRPPDRAIAYTAKGPVALRMAAGVFRSADLALETQPESRGHVLNIRLLAPETPVSRLHLRWHAPVPDGARLLGDEWERGYGEMEWRGMVPDRIMPWYFLLRSGSATHGYGVQTGAAALCFWQADAEGVSLWLDVRNGGNPVRLGDRPLDAATLVQRPGRPGESAFQAAQAFCRMLCPKPLTPPAPVFGGNNWYYMYGRNCSAERIVEDSDTIASLAPAGANRPFMVIDDGWQAGGSAAWQHGNERFPDMAGLAAKMRGSGVRPGIWMRPLYAGADTPRAWTISAKRAALDPTVPDARARIVDDVSRLAGWGYDLIKHDYSTFDLLGRWGFAMRARITDDAWGFYDPARTTAEIVLDLYRDIRRAAAGSLLIGCNTIGHLSAGLVELQRIGDDTSGRDWNRTRKMGVNSLAFRMPQHGAFFANDGDCVGLTTEIPWELNRQWLDLLTRSGTPLFVSAAPEALGPEQRKAVQAAFLRAARPQPAGEPLDWLDTTEPARWRFGRETWSYRWSGEEGPSVL